MLMNQSIVVLQLQHQYAILIVISNYGLIRAYAVGAHDMPGLSAHNSFSHRRDSKHRERLLPVWRRKGAVEIGEIMRGEANFERTAVLAHVRRVARLRDRADAVLPQYPRQGHLRRRGASVSRGDGLERRMAQQPALFDRRIGHDRQAALPGPGQQVVLDPAAGGVVEHLIGRGRVAATKIGELLHVVDVEIADAPATDLARGDQPLERVESFLERDIAAPVQEIEVDLIDAETPETAFAGRHDAAPGGMVRQRLADQEQPVAAPADRLPDQLLAAAIRIHLRSIDQRHPEIDAEAQRRDLVRSPPRVLRHVPSSLPERGNASAGGKRNSPRGRGRLHGSLPSTQSNYRAVEPPRPRAVNAESRQPFVSRSAS